MSSSPSASDKSPVQAPAVSVGDFAALTKARLSLLVVITAVCGYIAAACSHGTFSWGQLGHTFFGTLLCAFGAGIFNQVMEVEVDARMARTADRPLPGRRVPVAVAFLLGWVLSGFGIVHLGVKVNTASAAFAAATLGTYLFVYTPMKRRSAWNTVVGAVSGALPPLIGWAAGSGGGWLGWGPAYLFLLLFGWQMPHFLAINWMYREDYVRGGFVMWSNDDDTGRRTAILALVFSWLLVGVALLPAVGGLVHWWAAPFLLLLAGWTVWLNLGFLRVPDRARARRLFFWTLAYLPLALLVSLAGWRAAAQAALIPPIP